MSLTVDDFDFPLPPELIAQHPAAERTGSRLLHVCGAQHVDRRFADPAQPQRGDGDPELRRGEVGVETAQRLVERLGVHAARRHQLDYAAAPDGDEGEFCSDEKSVGGDEDENGDQTAYVGHSLLQLRVVAI